MVAPTTIPRSNSLFMTFRLHSVRRAWLGCRSLYRHPLSYPSSVKTKHTALGLSWRRNKHRIDLPSLCNQELNVPNHNGLHLSKRLCGGNRSCFIYLRYKITEHSRFYKWWVMPQNTMPLLRRRSASFSTIPTNFYFPSKNLPTTSGTNAAVRVKKSYSG